MLDSRLTTMDVAKMVAVEFGYRNLDPNEPLAIMLKAAVRAGAEYSENIQPEIGSE